VNGSEEVLARLGGEIVQAMDEGLAVHDEDQQLVGWNAAAEAITGWTADDAARHFGIYLATGLVHLDHGRWIDLRRFRTVHEGREHTVTLFTDARERVAQGEASRRLDRLAIELATRDPLTRLPNRMAGHDRLKQALAAGGAAVLWVGLDRFKQLNDTLGSQAGDRVLQEVSARLAGRVEPDTTVARVGPDQFGVVVPGRVDRAGAVRTAHQLLNALTPRMEIEGHELRLSASIGVAVAPDDGDDAASLAQHADAAMHVAKRHGGGRVHVFDRTLVDEAADRVSLEQSLRRALERGELLLAYQPKVDARTRRIEGLEALVRWEHPELGMLSPARFLPLAEETGLIADIDRWALQAACDQVVAWRADGRRTLPVAVNVSAPSFQRGDLAALVADALDGCRLGPEALEIEVTESAVMADPSEAERTLRQLRDNGVRLSIDDFGTGYSSLNYLKRFPIHALKIDRAFVTDLTVGSPDAIAADEAIVRATVALARGLRLEVIAEGVEEVAQQDILLDLGCYLMQGYLYSPPLPSGDASVFLARGLEEADAVLPIDTSPARLGLR
jgi:diguanylate cyclase (GGDEF)-like protein